MTIHPDLITRAEALTTAAACCEVGVPVPPAIRDQVAHHLRAAADATVDESPTRGDNIGGRL